MDQVEGCDPDSVQIKRSGLISIQLPARSSKRKNGGKSQMPINYVFAWEIKFSLSVPVTEEETVYCHCFYSEHIQVNRIVPHFPLNSNVASVNQRWKLLSRGLWSGEQLRQSQIKPYHKYWAVVFSVMSRLSAHSPLVAAGDRFKIQDSEVFICHILIQNAQWNVFVTCTVLLCSSRNEYKMQWNKIQ